MPRPSEIHIVEEAREPPPPGPESPESPEAERERRRRTLRVRDDARGPVCSGEGRARPGSQNPHRSCSAQRGCAHRPTSTLAFAEPPRVERRELTA